MIDLGKTDRSPVNPSTEQLLREISSYGREVDTRLDLLAGAVHRETTARLKAEAEWLKAEKRAEEAEARANEAETELGKLRSKSDVKPEACTCKQELEKARLKIAAQERYEEEAERQIADLEQKVRDLKAKLKEAEAKAEELEAKAATLEAKIPTPKETPVSVKGWRVEMTVSLDFTFDDGEDGEE